jgi:hypothetical protein
MEVLSCRSTAFFFPQETGKTASMKQQKRIKELLATNAGSFPWKKEHKLCLRFWMQPGKLQFRRNMFFLTAGFHHQVLFTR